MLRRTVSCAAQSSEAHTVAIRLLLAERVLYGTVLAVLTFLPWECLCFASKEAWDGWTWMDMDGHHRWNGEIDPFTNLTGFIPQGIQSAVISMKPARTDVCHLELHCFELKHKQLKGYWNVSCVFAFLLELVVCRVVGALVGSFQAWAVWLQRGDSFKKGYPVMPTVSANLKREIRRVPRIIQISNEQHSQTSVTFVTFTHPERVLIPQMQGAEWCLVPRLGVHQQFLADQWSVQTIWIARWKGMQNLNRGTALLEESSTPGMSGEGFTRRWLRWRLAGENMKKLPGWCIPVWRYLLHDQPALSHYSAVT